MATQLNSGHPGLAQNEWFHAVICAVKAFFIHVVNRDMGEIFNNFEGFSRELISNRQLCWKTHFKIGPEKGIVHLAIAAVQKTLWAKEEGKVTPMGLQCCQAFAICMEYRYITGVLPEEEAYEILQNGLLGKKERTENVKYAYTFKVKVGAYLQDDIYRLRSIQQKIVIATLNAECKAKWEIKEAIQWVTEPAGFKASCIKEPTFPDEDIHIQMGHATVSKLGVLGIGAATREHCHNRVIFKHLLQAKALSCLQVDSCRLGSVNESLSMLLMAKKFQRKALQIAAAMRKSFSPHPSRQSD
ncbi:mitochondrial enolase superfamily member 1 [Vidua macroura]|uniref:mitochondrial enolase superfamily member 1 n=1 Tax=Vidua macroura TaxID=187451 RepID=UPI0023A89E87|nr:mitochondrial enolase superfamily member 1 [Vidua macroura]